MAHKLSGAIIEVICGCMFSGKTEELIRVLKRATIAKQRVFVFKHSSDIRYSDESICSHNGVKISSILIQNTSEMFNYNLDNVDVVGIDEAQFFSAEILIDVEKLLQRGIRVVIAGLDMDFRKRPFGKMPELLSMANKVTKLSAICSNCGEEAHYTQRLIPSEETVFVGAIESYEPRCRKHHSYH
ncbi:thymidine kinase [Fluviispira multicolorata]|uniref:thymidine kinase n=1 Tax=Fluviispira multicolorata TaxID=2654512 RepID=UPI001B86792D|nr:thymidine kinase [Fluviispira multicolorata]